MHRKARAALAALLSALALTATVLLAAPASAHEYFPTDSRWKAGVIRVVVSDRTGADWDEVEAADAWNGVNSGTTGPFRFSYTTATCTNPCVIIDDKPAAELEFPDAPAIAYANKTYGGASVGTYIYNCQIHLNRDLMSKYTDWSYRRAVITHELGHCLGFKHTYEAFGFEPCQIIMAGSGGTYPTNCYRPTWRDAKEFAYHY